MVIRHFSMTFIFTDIQQELLRSTDGNTALTGHTIFFAPNKFDNKLKFVQFMFCYFNGDVINSFVVD